MDRFFFFFFRQNPSRFHSRLIDLCSLRRSSFPGGRSAMHASANDRPFSFPVAFHPVVTRPLIGSVILYQEIRVHSNSRALTVHDHEKVNEADPPSAGVEHHFDISKRATFQVSPSPPGLSPLREFVVKDHASLSLSLS